MLTTLQPVLDLLDEGLRLYRRYFVSYLLLAATWFVPLAIGIGLSIALWAYLSSGYALLLIGVWLLLSGPLAVYLVSSISRATVAAANGQPVVLRHALLIRPLRLLVMCVFAICGYFIANMATSALTICVICPIYTFALGMLGGLGGLGNTGGIGGAFQLAAGIVAGVLAILLYGFGLVLNGASYASVVYGLQSFAQEDLPLSTCLQRSIDALFYRFGRNLLAFLLASAIFGALTIAMTTTVGTLLPLPLLWILGSESTITQSVSAVAWLLALILILPPLPIWMALLYRRNVAQREGYDIHARMSARIVRQQAPA